MIDVVDVAPTLVGYLKGVDIPLMSIGKARNFYGKNHSVAYMRILQQNFVQLLHGSTERKVVIDDQLSLDLLVAPVDTSDAQAVQRRTHLLEKEINKIKAMFYGGGAIVGFFNVSYFAVLAAFLTIFLLDMNKILTGNVLQLINGEKIVVLLLLYWFVYVNIGEKSLFSFVSYI
jgi:hypothetical protein